jgi:hypothetical protein
VLTARAHPGDTASAAGNSLFDLRSVSARMVIGRGREYLRIDHGSGVVRIDIVDGSVREGPVSLRFELGDNSALPVQLDALRQYRELSEGGRTDAQAHRRLADMLLPLHAFDERARGASLRFMADALLGAGDWPGDGEHRKSRVRRLVATGEALMRAGPRTILAFGPGF